MGVKYNPEDDKPEWGVKKHEVPLRYSAICDRDILNEPIVALSEEEPNLKTGDTLYITNLNSCDVHRYLDISESVGYRVGGIVSDDGTSPNNTTKDESYAEWLSQQDSKKVLVNPHGEDNCIEDIYTVDTWQTALFVFLAVGIPAAIITGLLAHYLPSLLWGI